MEWLLSIAYVRDIAALVLMAVAVYEKDISLHLQVETNIPKHIFALGQQNYSRYLSYQPRLSDNHQDLNSPSFQDIIIDGLRLIIQG